MTESPATIAAAPAAPLDARDWQATLIGLLGRLEDLRTEMAPLRLKVDAARLLTLADAMVAACDDLAHEVPAPPALATAQVDAVGKAGAYYSTAALVRPAVSQSGVLRTMLSALTGSAPQVASADVRDALLAAVEAVHLYFALFTAQFNDSQAARPFVDAAAAFATDLKDVVRQLPRK